MISDILFDARMDIEEYLKDKKIKKAYGEKVYFEIIETLQKMELLQLKLDWDII